MVGIVVSNHAGRQVDGAIASLDALENIVNGKANNLRMVEEVLRQKMLAEQQGQGAQASAGAK